MLNRCLNFLYVFQVNFRRHFLKELLLVIGLVFASFILISGASLKEMLHHFYSDAFSRYLSIDSVQIDGTVKLSRGKSNNIEKQIHSIPLSLIDKIKEWDEVKEVIPISKSHFPVSLTLTIPASSQSFFFELPLIGIPDKLIYHELLQQPKYLELYKKKFPTGFREYNHRVPVLIPKFAQIFAKHFTDNHQLTSFDIIQFLNMLNLKLVMNHSFIKIPFFNKKTKPNQPTPIVYDANVVGVSHLRVGTGLFIPQSTLEKLKKQIFPNQVSGFESLQIHLHQSNSIDSITQRLGPYLKKFHLEIAANSMLDNISKATQDVVTGLNTSLTILSGIILILACFSIVYAFQYLFLQRYDELKLYRLLGASNKEINLLLILEGSIVSLISISIGFMLSYYFVDVILPSRIQDWLQILPVDWVNQFFPSATFRFPFLKNLQLSLIIFLFCILSLLTALFLGHHSRSKRIQ